MSFVFYDTETTGTNTAFDQILQFAAIRVDSDLREQERFEIRSRLLPHVVPAPGAMRVTGISVGRLTDPALPTHYQMVREIRDKLSAWSPAVFVGFNSLTFDEHLLRQALYQTLHPPYLTNTDGNCRADAMRIAQAAYLYAPDTLKIPVGGGGRRVFKLDRLAPLNGFPHESAHDALADVEATIHLCRLVVDRAPDLWSALMRFTQKAAVREYIQAETVFSLSEFYFGRPNSWIVTPLISSIENGSECLVFDLAYDPAELKGTTDTELAKQLKKSPRPVRRVRFNSCPIMMPLEDAPEIASAKTLGEDELRRRAQTLADDGALCERLSLVFEGLRDERAPSPHVEEKIYDGFYSPVDLEVLNSFHEVPWEKRSALIEKFQDPRLKELGQRLVYVERPDLLSKEQQRELKDQFARRLTGSGDAGPWLTLPMAIQEADELLEKVATEEKRGLLEYKKYLVQRLKQASGPN